MIPMAEAEKAYMQSPLVLWVETFKANDGHPLEYKDLYDGVFLNDVMQQIDPRPAYERVNRHVEDVSVRLHNWDILVRNVRGYYRDVLQQLLVLRLPNITAICRDPGKESSFAEIRRALLLVLGCAVQCEQKESFIDRIMAMDITAQTEIVDNIKEVTDDCGTVLPTQRPESPTSCNAYVDKLFHHLYRLIQERDQCAELACDLGQERDFYMSQAEGKPVVDSPQLTPDKHHLALELAECKAKLRHIRQELEDRQEQLSDVKDELRDSMANIANLKQENASLLQEARTTRSLRDELDILKEKASQVDMFEKEILKYKERLNELEFYKARTEELKEDNSILEETKAMLETQLEGSRKRIETVVELESEMRKYRQQVEEMAKERASEREKLEYLTEENARLEFEKKSSMNESASLESELSAVRSRIGNMGSSLSEQLSETSHAHVLRLELENQRLAAQLAEMKESALIHNAEISLEMEKENQRLAKKVEKLQTSACESSEQAVRAENELATVREEKSRLAQALDALKDNVERQVTALEKENEQLSQALDNIRERSEKTSDARVKDLERENKHLHEAVTAKNTELSKLEFEGRQLQRSVHQLEDNKHRLRELEQENQGLEKENSELHQKLSTLQHVAERVEIVEQESSDLSCENRKLQRTVETLQAAQTRREKLEQEHISLQVEHQRLQRTLESMKGANDRCVELETEKDELNQQLQQTRRSLDGQKSHKLKQEQMEFELIDMTNEKQKLQKSMEVTTRRLHQLEKDNMDIETENDKLTKELEDLKVEMKRLEERDKEAGALDAEVVKLHKDKVTLEKENRKLKQSSELKESSLEELKAKLQALDKESKSLRRSLEKMKETCAKVKDLERDNSELIQELNTDRRTLATLREDLVNEKIRSQELSNELEQLTGELEKVGINTHKLSMAEQTNDANRYKALETMIEDTLKKSSELKEEKIQGLESRLEQSKTRNLKLQEELRLAHRDTDTLRQRLEEWEEEAGLTPARPTPTSARDRDAVDGRDRPARPPGQSATKEIFQLKDHLVDLERNNAKLQTETENLRSNNSSLSDQCRRLEAQLSNMQAQHTAMHGHYSSLKEQDAKLQVEYSTVQSQLSSQLSQQEGLKSQLTRLGMDHENLQQKHEGLQSSHTSLVSNHESLQRLHEQLTSEYESLMAEHGSLKSMHKTLKVEHKEAQEQLQALLTGKEDVNKLRSALEQERDRVKRELNSLGSLQTEHSKLRDDHGQMRAAYDKLSLDYSQVLHSHKQVKTDYNNLQLKATELQGELNEAKENMSVADVEFQKLENKIETVYQINERIENENQALLMQIKQLLNQNHDLLTQALNSKDHFAEEEKAYLEKLSDLRRQKERLEEKIMEHYKNRMSPKKKGLGALIARKARGIISRGPRRSKSRNNLHEGLDNSSQGSGSTEHINDGSRRLDDVSSLMSAQCAVLGAKSTENVNDVSSGDCLLPGIGRPYKLDQEDGQAQRSTTPGLGKRVPGRSSPGSEMLALDQFLKEANKSPRNDTTPPGRRTSNDSESRASENSNNSNNNVSNSMSKQRAGSSGQSQLRPDMAELATSSTSLLSPGFPRAQGEADNSSLSSSGGGRLGSFPDVFTSTPKAQQDGSSPSSSGAHQPTARRQSGDSGSGGGRYSSHNRLSGGDDWRSSSQESSPYASTSRMNVYATPASSSSPRDVQSTGAGPHSLNHQENHTYQAGNLNINRDRDLPPVPKDPPPPIPAADRLDRLTMLASPLSARDHQTPPSSQAGQNWPPSRREDDHTLRRSSQGPGGERHQVNHSSGGALLPDQFQPPVPRSQPPLVNSTPTSGRQQQRIEDSSVVSGHNPRRPAANLMPGQNNAPNHQLHRARPASAMGPSPHVRAVISRPPGEGRPRQQQQQQQQQLQQQQQQQQQQAPGRGMSMNQPERPKSVPPHMFQLQQGEDGPATTNAIGQRRDIRDMPVAAVRRTTREDQDSVEASRSGRSSSVSLLREPSRSASRGPSDPQPSPSLVLNSSNHSINNHHHQQQQQPPTTYPPKPQQQPSTTTYSHHHNQQQQSHHHFHHHHQQQQHQQQNNSSSNNGDLVRPNNGGRFAPQGGQPYLRQPGRPGGQPDHRPDTLALATDPRPRSQSSMGQPSGPFSPPGSGPHGRSSTPAGLHTGSHTGSYPGSQHAGPHNGPQAIGRRDSAPAQYHTQERLDQRPGHKQGYNDGPDYNRQSRAGSLPRDSGYSPAPRPTPAPAPRGQPYSQGAPQQRGQPRPGFDAAAPTSNGPHSAHMGTGSSQHPGSYAGPTSQQQSQAVPPQIRSQGRPVTNALHVTPPPSSAASSSNRQVGSPSSPQSPPLAEQQASPGVAEAAEGGKAKSTSSIWYEYGCV